MKETYQERQGGGGDGNERGGDTGKGSEEERRGDGGIKEVDDE
jgi:hypothetical protein